MLCEKPLCTTVADCLRVRELVREQASYQRVFLGKQLVATSAGPLLDGH